MGKEIFFFFVCANRVLLCLHFCLYNIPLKRVLSSSQNHLNFVCRRKNGVTVI